MSLKYMLAALCLAAGIVATPPDGKSILGYRTVHADEAAKINAAGAPVWDGKDYGGGKQLGPGVYTTPNQGGWTPNPGEWVCVIYADTAALDRTSKLWVPSYDGYTGLDLWWRNSPNIPAYVDSFGYGWDPAKTLYMGYISDWGTALQLLIPPALVDPAGALGLSAVCVEDSTTIPDTATVDYNAWQNNIDGDKGQPDS